MTNISNEGNVPQPRGNPVEELLARLDPEIQELARQIGDKIASQEELETFIGQQKREIDDRLDELEAKVADLIKVVKIFAREPLAETMPTEPLCGTCDTSIEHIPAHPDGRPGGWRHTTDHGQEPHTAYPGGGGRS